ncbi:hypothetical protein QKW35_14560 [Pontibacterium granulatum]|uniref:hypothetical protein n=1 Tax=Pontibacterium granulatum TaxID=2036029 RepID=UPI00249A7E4C|nr:hypothetical protein [Pontibacterium granulatum]MDI3325598.1 hypothetical protein [Pontibacterium granulatum]
MKINGPAYKSTTWFADGKVIQREFLMGSLETSFATAIATWLSNFVPSLVNIPGNDLSTLGEPVIIAKNELPPAPWHSTKC